MSIREPPERDLHIAINNGATMVSTNQFKPSRLPISILANIGLPNGSDTVIVNDVIIHVKFPKGDDSFVYAWAETLSSGETKSSCTIF